MMTNEGIKDIKSDHIIFHFSIVDGRMKMRGTII
jgi:hypothetical protein